MAVPTAIKLLDSAKSGEKKLTPRERRHVVSYIKATQPDTPNTDMAEWFGVSEKTIRMDLLSIRKEKAKLIKEDDVGLVIADIALDYERQVMDIERSKAKAKLGTGVYLQHCTSAMELRLKMIKALQDIGYLPKNLGNMTVQKFDYKAVVDERTGAVDGVYQREFLRSMGEVVDEPEYLNEITVEPLALTEGLNEQNSETGDERTSVSDAASEKQDSGSAAGIAQAAPDPVPTS